MSNKLKPIEPVFSSPKERERVFDEYFERYRRSSDLSVNPIDPHEWIQKLPKTLYKYRTSNEYDIAAFENGDLWFSHPVVWDDDMDASVRFETIGEVRKKIGTDFGEFVLRSFWPIIRNALPSEERKILDDKSIRRYNKRMFDPNGSINKGRATALFVSLGMKQNLAKMFTEQLASAKKDFAAGNLFRKTRKFIKDIKERSENIRKEHFMASLSENGTSDYMWQEYARNGDGFLVCYSLDFIDDQSPKMIGATAPMMYGVPKRFEFSSLVMELLAVELLRQGKKGQERVVKNRLEIIARSVWTKDPKYEFEQEWRITFGPKDAEELGARKGGLLHFPYAKKVILGWNLSKEKRERIVAAAKKQKCDIEFKDPPNTKRITWKSI